MSLDVANIRTIAIDPPCRSFHKGICTHTCKITRTDGRTDMVFLNSQTIFEILQSLSTDQQVCTDLDLYHFTERENTRPKDTHPIATALKKLFR